MDVYASYIHHAASGSYRVRRHFDSVEAAQYFIDCNALVFPLPGARIEDFNGNEITEAPNDRSH